MNESEKKQADVSQEITQNQNKSISEFEQIFNKKLNNLRKNPKDFIANLQILKKYSSTNNQNNKDNFNSQDNNKEAKSLKDLTDIISHIKSFPLLKISEALTKAAYEYCFFIKDPTSKNFFAEEDELMKIRLGHYAENIEKVKHYKELVFTSSDDSLFIGNDDDNNNNNIDDLLSRIMIQEYQKSERDFINITSKSKFHDISFLNEKFRLYGFCFRKIKNNVNLLVIVFTDSNFANKNSFQENNELLYNNNYMKSYITKCINEIRIYPRAFMKYIFEDNCAGSFYNPFTNKNNKDLVENKLIEFLAKSKSCRELIEDNDLSEMTLKLFIAESQKDTRINSNNIYKISKLLLNKKTIKDSSNEVIEDLKEKEILEGLSKKYSSFRNTYVIRFENKLDYAENILIGIIRDEENKEILFINSLNYIGIHVHINQSTNKVSIYLIFCDHLVKRKDLLIPQKTAINNFNRNKKKLDEFDIQLVKSDFLNLDVNSNRKINPSYIATLLKQITKTEGNFSFIYLRALDSFAMENPAKASNGININEFVEIIKNYFDKINFDEEDYKDFYLILKHNKNIKTNFHNLKKKNKLDSFLKSAIDYPEFKKLLIDLGYSFNEIQAQNVFESISFPENNLNSERFIQILKLQEDKKNEINAASEKNDNKINNNANKESLKDRIVLLSKAEKESAHENDFNDQRDNPKEEFENEQTEKNEIFLIKKKSESRNAAENERYNKVLLDVSTIRIQENKNKSCDKKERRVSEESEKKSNTEKVIAIKNKNLSKTKKSNENLLNKSNQDLKIKQKQNIEIEESINQESPIKIGKADERKHDHLKPSDSPKTNNFVIELNSENKNYKEKSKEEETAVDNQKQKVSDNHENSKKISLKGITLDDDKNNKNANIDNYDLFNYKKESKNDKLNKLVISENSKIDGNNCSSIQSKELSFLTEKPINLTNSEEAVEKEVFKIPDEKFILIENELESIIDTKHQNNQLNRVKKGLLDAKKNNKILNIKTNENVNREEKKKKINDRLEKLKYMVNNNNQKADSSIKNSDDKDKEYEDAEKKKEKMRDLIKLTEQKFSQGFNLNTGNEEILLEKHSNVEKEKEFKINDKKENENDDDELYIPIIKNCKKKKKKIGL